MPRLPPVTDGQAGPPELVASILKRRGGMLQALDSLADDSDALGDDRLLFERVTVIAAYNMVLRILVAFEIETEDH